MDEGWALTSLVLVASGRYSVWVAVQNGIVLNATIVQGRFKSLLYKTITRSHPQIVKVRISLGYNWSSEEHVAGSQVARWQ